MNMNRRRFLSLSLAGAGHLAFGSEPDFPANDAGNARIVMAGESLGQVPVDYTGLSYEAAQLYNPAFFSDTNRSLVAAFRKLSSHGVLRLGGNLSEFTVWSETEPAGRTRMARSRRKPFITSAAFSAPPIGS